LIVALLAAVAALIGVKMQEYRSLQRAQQANWEGTIQIETRELERIKNGERDATPTPAQRQEEIEGLKRDIENMKAHPDHEY
jgi:hypothetical protein